MMCINSERESRNEEDQDIPSPERGDQDPCDGGDGEGYESVQEEHC